MGCSQVTVIQLFGCQLPLNTKEEVSQMVLIGNIPQKSGGESLLQMVWVKTR